MEAVDAARRWADTWQRRWPARDLEAILALYHPDVTYASEPFRVPFKSIEELRVYLAGAFAEEEEIEDGTETTLVGTSTLRFDLDGRALEQRDTWNQAAGRVPPREGWGR